MVRLTVRIKTKAWSFLHLHHVIAADVVIAISTVSIAIVGKFVGHPFLFFEIPRREGRERDRIALALGAAHTQLGHFVIS
jgi:hypothetical protein